MNTLDLDVLHEIFKLACTDGGFTGASLSRTSKSIRAASASVRFYSIRLNSLRIIGAFIFCYDPRRETERASPALTFLPRDCDAPPRRRREWTYYFRGEHRLPSLQLADDVRTWMAEKSVWNHDIARVLTQLFALVAPSLRTLTVLQCPEIRLPLVRCTLPALRKLTLLADERMFIRVRGRSTTWVPFLDDPSDFNGVPAHPPYGAPPFPVLTHLHIVCEGDKLHPWGQTLPL